jgi:ABC-type Mn2+/Zn2+ transport system ATPase subunit
LSGDLVRLERAAIGYGGRALLHSVDLAIAPGDFLAMVGPNGGGKTTLLRSMLGTLPLVAGRREARRGLRVGYVPQRDQVDLIWPLSAEDVVMMGRFPMLGPWRRAGPAVHAAARRALEQVGIGGVASQGYRTLSGGQRQRTLIARALVAEPELLALDEPTSGMDPGAELATMDVVRDLWRGGTLAVVMVSHRLEAVANYARSLAFVDAERGLFRIGGLDEMLRPEALGELYGRPVAVREERGRRLVYPLADGEEP